MRFACNKKGKCVKCGQCCHFRESFSFSAEEEDKLKRKLFEKTGVVYLFPWDRYTISVSEEEMNVMEKRARDLKIKIKFIPKRIFVGVSDEVKVLDWSIDHDVCPFYDKLCLIYPDRPIVCQKFPERYELPFDKSLEKTSLSYDKALELAKKIL
ncbi:YkgJ family cysteine cluster protein [Nanoarchaeota archaeon]